MYKSYLHILIFEVVSHKNLLAADVNHWTQCVLVYLWALLLPLKSRWETVLLLNITLRGPGSEFTLDILSAKVPAAGE